jgi:hypothetical protein
VPAARKEWKVGMRDREPEKEEFNVDKLHKRLRSQQHAGAMPTKIGRRVSLGKRGQRLVAQKSELKRKEAQVSAALAEVHRRANS